MTGKEETMHHSVGIRPEQILAPVRREMAAVESLLRREVETADPRLLPLMRDASLLRGKGLRPALVLLAAKATGEVVEDHVRLAGVIEMIHNATLVHDDILDEATARRNRITINLKYNNETAVLVGDYIFARAFVLAAGLRAPGALARLTTMTARICRGEIQQVLRRFDADMDEADYLEVIARKTASLYETAAELGAVLAGAEDGAVAALAGFGRAVGVAFQIVDDCLDVTGEEARMGKTLATDLDKGKFTLPVIRFLRRAAPPARAEFLALVGSSLSRAEKKRRVLALLEEEGALRYALERATEETRTAKALLQELPPSPAREALELLADFVVHREV